jgi:hypothetical protein
MSKKAELQLDIEARRLPTRYDAFHRWELRTGLIEDHPKDPLISDLKTWRILIVTTDSESAEEITTRRGRHVEPKF